jgi:hypothetical protein
MPKRTRTTHDQAGKISLRLDATTLDAVDKLCQERSVTRSALLRIAVVEYLGMRSDAQAVGLTLMRILELLEKLDATISASGADLRSMGDSTRIHGQMCEAILKVLLYRVPPPSPVEEAASRARAAADYSALTKEVARRLSRE